MWKKIIQIGIDLYLFVINYSVWEYLNYFFSSFIMENYVINTKKIKMVL